MVFIASMQSLQNRFERAIQVFEYLVIPETHHDEARTFQDGCACGIRFGPLRVLATIQFDGKHSLQTSEIEDVVAKGMLTPEFTTIELPCPQPLPKPAFGIGGIVAQVALQFGTENETAGLSFHPPSPINNTIPTQFSP